MRKQVPVLFDATHSVQRPSSNHGISGGDRNLIPYLASGAVMIGVDGLYMEIHPCPEKTLSDGAVQFPVSNVENLWREILEVRVLQVKLDSRPLRTVVSFPSVNSKGNVSSPLTDLSRPSSITLSGAKAVTVGLTYLT